MLITFGILGLKYLGLESLPSARVMAVLYWIRSMTINISMLNATGKLDENLVFLGEQVNRSLEIIKFYIDIPDLDITVSPYSKEKVSPFGIGGFAFNAHRVEIFLDCDREDLESVIKRELTAVLGHEINHAIRKGHGHKSITLLDNLIMEGLACHFEMILNKGKVSSMFEGMLDCDWIDLFESMKPSMMSASFPFEEMFLGTNLKKYPRYAGYWVGYNIVVDYVKKQEISAAKLVDIEAGEFIL